jgi:hypothetical protein
MYFEVHDLGVRSCIPRVSIYWSVNSGIVDMYVSCSCSSGCDAPATRNVVLIFARSSSNYLHRPYRAARTPYNNNVEIWILKTFVILVNLFSVDEQRGYQMRAYAHVAHVYFAHDNLLSHAFYRRSPTSHVLFLEHM